MAAVSLHQKTTVGFAPTTERRQAVLLCAELRGLARMSEVLEPSLVLAARERILRRSPRDLVAAHGGEAMTSQHDMLLSAFARGSAAAGGAAGGARGAAHPGGFPGRRAERWRASYGLRTAVAQGLHLGEAVLGLAGPDGLERRVAFGDSVSLAQCHGAPRPRRRVRDVRGGDGRAVGREPRPRRRAAAAARAAAPARRSGSTACWSKAGWTSPGRPRSSGSARRA